MAHEFTISEFGLKLIKAFEGFRAAETTLVTGQRVIGYGHRFHPDEEGVLTRKKAESLLKQDLEPFEALVNESIFAPLSQSQFDALVSFAFNIGPKAFTGSSVVHALNNGRPLDAASGFDQWRKSTIEGKVYVIDALMRRRTAEKALFLRTSNGELAAPRLELPPEYSEIKPEELPTFTQSEADGIVARTPYQVGQAKKRRREDGPAGILTLSEFADQDSGTPVEAKDDLVVIAHSQTGEAEKAIKPSPIAIAAAEVSDQLDRLIATPEEDLPSADNDFSDTDILDLDSELPLIDDTKPMPARNPDAFITKSTPTKARKSGLAAYWLSLIIGACLLGAGATKLFFSPDLNLNPLLAFVAPVATIVGAMMVLGALYYLIKQTVRSNAAVN